LGKFSMTTSAGASLFPLDWVRGQFPALQKRVGNHRAVFFDGPAGSQVPQRVIDAMAHYMVHANANHAGLFATSRQSDRLLHQAHQTVADFLGTDDPKCVIFGANMTTLTFALSRAIARTWSPGDEVVVTQLDHDANVTPWVLAAADAGVEVQHAEICPADCTLDLKDLAARITPRTKLVAVTCASNAVGTITPIEEIVAMAHHVGALVFLDAVHYAPHRLIDVDRWNCDLLACSAYKFFGPHVGVLWGRRKLLEQLPAYKVRPAPEELPGRWMTGTQNHEGIVGVAAAIDYLAELGRKVLSASSAAEEPESGSPASSGRSTGKRPADTTADRQTRSASRRASQMSSDHRQPAKEGSTCGGQPNRRQCLQAAYQAIEQHERRLVARLLAGLEQLPAIRVWGIAEQGRLENRVPTVAITHKQLSPRQMAERLDACGIFTWHGNFYALPLTEALGLEPEGLLRIGILHYNTEEEIDRLLDALSALG